MYFTMLTCNTVHSSCSFRYIQKPSDARLFVWKMHNAVDSTIESKHEERTGNFPPSYWPISEKYVEVMLRNFTLSHTHTHTHTYTCNTHAHMHSSTAPFAPQMYRHYELKVCVCELMLVKKTFHVRVV